MKTRVIVQSPEDYKAWEDSQKTVAAKDPVTVAAMIHDEAMVSQVKAMGFDSDHSALSHLRHEAISMNEVAQIAQSL
jgi:heme/copper-type cytochrome/quinol oxidase subunit 2